MKRVLGFVCTLFVLLSNIGLLFSSSGNQQQIIDSLQLVLKTAKDTQEINVLNALSKTYSNISSYNEALEYANKAMQKAEVIGFKKGYSNSLINLGYVKILKAEYPEAIEIYTEAIKLCLAINDKKGLGNSYNNLGLIYWYKGEHNKAVDNFIKSLKVREEAKDKLGVAMSYLNMGNIYLDQQKDDKALEYYLKSLKINEELNHQRFLSTNLNNIGVVYSNKGNSDKALEYYTRALEINKIVGDPGSIAMSYGNVGLVYENKKNYERALENYFKSVELNKRINNKQGLAVTYTNIGRVYGHQKKNEEALKYHTAALDLVKSIGYKKGLMEVYSNMESFYEATGDYKQALTYSRKYSEIKDSLVNEESSKHVEEINSKYGSEKKDKEIQLLNKEKEKQAELAASESRRHQLILWSISIVLFLVVVFALFVYRNFKLKQRLSQELEMLSLVAQETDNGVLICGPAGEIEWSNAGLTRLLGYTFDELKQRGKTIAELSSNPEIKNVIAESIKNKKSSTYQVLNVTKDGTERWVQSTLTPILDSTGNVKKIVVIDTDISERKKIENQLSRQNEDLERSQKDISILSEIGQLITSTLSVEKIVEKTYGSINQLMDADIFCVGIYNEQNNSIDFPGFLEKGVKYNSSYDLKDNNRLPVLCFKEKREIIINDLEKEYQKYIPTLQAPIAGEHPESLIYLPLFFNDKVIGVINVESFHKNAYNSYHLNLLKTLATYVAIAIENARLYESMEDKVKLRTAELVKRNDEIEKTYENIQVLSEIGQQLTSTLDIESIFSQLHENVKRLMTADVFGIRIYHPESETVEAKYEYENGIRQHQFTFTLENESNLSAWCIKNKKDIFINDYAVDYVKYAKEVVIINGDMTHSLMFCPMILKQKVIGVVTVQCFQKNAFSKQHLDILRTLANYAAIAIENARLYDNIKVLNEIGQEITSTLDLGKVLDTVYAKVNSLMDATEFGFGIYNSEKQAIDFSNYYYESKKMEADLDTWVSMKDDNRLSVWCAKNRKPVFINDIQKEYSAYISNLDSYIGEGKLLLESVMCLPLIVGEKMVGLISVQSPKKHAYTKGHMEILQTMASYIAIALDNAHLYNNMEDEIVVRTREIEKQKVLVEDKNLKITDSINYALRIQQAILPSQAMISSILPDAFVFFKPKDIVSGDFYWAYAADQHQILFAAVDCTGHGVPGAFMSIMGYNLLEQIVKEQKIYEPAAILNELSVSVVKSLKQTDQIGSLKEGMDIALCKIDYRTFELEYAGAHNSLNIVRDGVLLETKANKRSIGISLANSAPFTNHKIQLEKGDCIYIFSDGYVDQKGGPQNQKFFSQPFKQLLVDIHAKEMGIQEQTLEQIINQWKQGREQIDDMLVIGVRV